MSGRKRKSENRSESSQKSHSEICGEGEVVGKWMEEVERKMDGGGGEAGDEECDACNGKHRLHTCR